MFSEERQISAHRNLSLSTSVTLKSLIFIGYQTLQEEFIIQTYHILTIPCKT